MFEPRLSLATICGPEIAVFDYGGSGPALLLLHGGGRSSEDWDQVARILVDEYRVVAFDLRGHGLSSPMGLSWSFDEAVDQIDAVAGSLDLRWPVVVGHSLGGMVATLYAARNPSCPGAMNVDGVGVSIPRRFPGQEPERDEATVRDLVASMLPKPGELDPLGTAVMDLDVFDVMRSIRCPFEFVAATGDGEDGGPDRGLDLWRAAVAHEVELLARARPAIGLSTVDCGHLVPTQRPDELAALIRKLFGRATVPNPVPRMVTAVIPVTSRRTWPR
jgi:pimeloyl-ACP methyl ester carboxylesterase